MGLRRFFKNFLYKKKYNLKNLEPKKIINQNILITGANSGIGFSLTKKLVNHLQIIF